jgi:hypothetical protein
LARNYAGGHEVGKSVKSQPRKKFERREVASRRVEWLVKPPDPNAAGDPQAEYDRYETDRYQVMQRIEAECGDTQPHDLRVIELPEETIISYEIQRVLLTGRGE